MSDSRTVASDKLTVKVSRLVEEAMDYDKNSITYHSKEDCKHSISEKIIAIVKGAK